jgi:hypothetical protein
MLKKFFLLACGISFSIFTVDSSYLNQVQKLIIDVKNGHIDKAQLNQGVGGYGSAPLLLLTRQNMSIEKILQRNDIKITQAIAGLLAAGADPNIIGSQNETSLRNALFHSSVDVVKMLLQAGAKPNLKVQSYLYGTSNPLLIDFLHQLDTRSMAATQAAEKIVLLRQYNIDLTMKDVVQQADIFQWLDAYIQLRAAPCTQFFHKYVYYEIKDALQVQI